MLAYSTALIFNEITLARTQQLQKESRMISMNEKEKYMEKALELAALGAGKVSPNPMVGCVIVKDGRIISYGHHENYGGFHAERNALLSCMEDPQGAELYVNLEPCCHQGKTPPCTDIIIEKKIKKVYIGSLDVNPKVAGKGVKTLLNHQIQVETGILEAKNNKLNEVFIHYMQTNLPFVAMKYAMTLDGKIACATGDSKWVTQKAAREQVQVLRNNFSGIMIGIGTALADNPMLNCRMQGGKNPVRIICDSKLRIPLDSKIVKTALEIPTMVAFCQENRSKQQELEQAGITLLKISKGEQAGVDLKELMKELGRRNIDSVLLEGGGTLNASMLNQHFVQRVYGFIAPKLVAGKDAKSPIEGIGIAAMKDAVCLEEIEWKQYGPDICITGIIK
ncbi:MAG: bifunctional diaminohydroxyphosphoribosylaminopyrimidine deaminase/5-amino-6-(5-phosphoribosylamino)uracil reductase RibD [Lachnospiraceae bacterium]